MSFDLSSSPLYAANDHRREPEGFEADNGEKGRSAETRSLQAVIFDYGKVLSYGPTVQQWQELASTAGRRLAEFQPDYWRYREEYDRASCGAAAYWQAVARRPLEPKTLGKLIELDNEQWTRVNPEMLRLARRLRKAGAKTAILSNMEFEMLAAMEAKFEWLSEFAVRIFSCKVRMIKPGAEIFLHAAAELGVEPGCALFVDDKQPNVDGARRVGMQAFRFDAPESRLELEQLLLEKGLLSEVDETVGVRR
jgi:putative hydrolase of the HAD superfamily